MAITYAVRHPERVSHLILYGTYARGGPIEATLRSSSSTDGRMWPSRGVGGDGTSPAYRQFFTGTFAPNATEVQARSFNDLRRMSASPENAVKFFPSVRSSAYCSSGHARC